MGPPDICEYKKEWGCQVGSVKTKAKIPAIAGIF
jgi:hypothetical protein